MPYGSIANDRLRNINYDRMRKYRIDRTLMMMERDGIDAIISWEPWDIRYIASCYVPMSLRWKAQSFCVLPRGGEPHLFTITTYNEEMLQKEMPWLNGRVYAAPEGGKAIYNVYQTEEFMKAVGSILAEYGITSGRIGLDACPDYFTYQEAFARKGFTTCDCAQAMFDARMIKNEDEIACVRYACYAADAAFSAIQKHIHPGMRECDIQGYGMEALYNLCGDETMDFVVATGPRTNPLHIDFTDRIIRPGDFVVVDINGNSFQGYKSCYYRTFICGEATKEEKEVYEVARKMMYDGLAQIKAGNTTDDVLDVWPKDPQFWGYDDVKWLGGYGLAHGIGLSLHELPQFGVGGPHGMKPPTVTFEKGMCIAIETYYGDKDHNRNAFGTRLEECFTVTEDGVEIFTKYPVGQIIECPL